MPHLLFKLHGVPEDEEIAVRRLLDEHGIDYYETGAGLLGISLAALWLRDDSEPEPAQQLIHNYQEQRGRQAREEYRQQQLDGTAETLQQRLLQQPLRTLLYLAAIAAVLYLSTIPFMMLMG